MPVIEVHLLEGYAPSDHQRLGEAITDATRLVIPAPADAITVIIHELAQSHYFRGRGARLPAPALPEPCALVNEFLDCLGRRDLQRAKTFLASNFSMHFPAADSMHDLEALIDWSASRYRSITKTMESTEAYANAAGHTVVICQGTLDGEWPDGSAFSGIRFIDRFEVINGKITRQDVWNDMAEHRNTVNNS